MSGGKGDFEQGPVYKESPPGPLVVCLGDLKMLLSPAVNIKSGEYQIGFTPSDVPLDTEDKKRAHRVDPVMILQFQDEKAMMVLIEMMRKLIRYYRGPCWVPVSTTYVDDGLAP